MMNLSGTLKALCLVLVCVGLVLSPAFAGLSSAEALSAEEIKAEAEKYTALGAEYSEKGFPGLPPKMTPFAQWRRIDTGRLQGKEVYVWKKVRIWKTTFCGGKGSVFLELSLMDRKGKQTPFAWQECKVDCQDGGSCGEKTRLFIDINGNGDADVLFSDMSKLGRMKKGFLKNPRFIFEKDILPLWLKQAFGKKMKNLNTIGPGDSVPAWKDHPLTVESEEKGGDL